jgi:hypothetical protein
MHNSRAGYYLVRLVLFRCSLSRLTAWVRSAFINFVISLTFPMNYPFAREVTAGAVQSVLPKLYAFSMMWTLNERIEIRVAHLSCEVNGSASGFDFRSEERELTVVVRLNSTIP